MKKRRHTAEEIIRNLRQGEVLLGQGKLIADVCRDLCISGDVLQVAEVVLRDEHESREASEEAGG